MMREVYFNPCLMILIDHSRHDGEKQGKDDGSSVPHA